MDIKTVHSIAESIYGDYRVSLEDSMPGFENGSYLVIYYPVVKITNEHHKSYIKKNLYVILKLAQGNGIVKIINFKVMTSSMTLQEYTQKYVHSHVNFAFRHAPNNGYDYVPDLSVCTGSGPLSRIYSFVIEKETNVIHILTLIDQFLSVESLEGVPYRRLEHLNTRTGTVSYAFSFNNRYAIPVSVAQAFIASMAEYPIISTPKGIKYGISLTEGVLLAHKFLDTLPEGQKIGQLRPAILHKGNLYSSRALSSSEYENYISNCARTAAVKFKGKILNIEAETKSFPTDITPLNINDAALCLLSFCELYLTHAYIKINS